MGRAALKELYDDAAWHSSFSADFTAWLQSLTCSWEDEEILRTCT